MALKRLLIYGSRGGLGSVCTGYFKSKNFVLDFKENPNADLSIVIPNSESPVNQHAVINKSLLENLAEHKLDAIICVAGGWAGGNASHNDFLKNMELTWKQSVWSSSIASSVATKYLATGGLLVLSGSESALNGTPNMLGYGMAKAAVHHLTKSLALKGSGLPTDCDVLAILPVILDTPMNRKCMPKADRSTWTPLEFVAQ
ncbi:unnamed protein product [Echinostoma caproni]|uniref:Dihydropteridine reductase n=1 Tax=Echinostoma caproni TaxID=27848 RepID=A0A183B4F2_9TREM|nr:unnamed protein product [Echinostoma caproni]